MSSIIIYNNENKIKNITDIIKYNDKIYLLYDGKIINPPFFDKIIVMHDDLKQNELEMIYNMLNVNGKIYFINKYTYFFNDSQPYKEKLFQYQKKNNFQYIINYVPKGHNRHFVDDGRTVEFIIMGTQKGGTTALSLNISKHPDIYIDNNPDPKKSEIHFYDIYWKNGIKYYKSKFDYSKKVVGEKTPDLMYLSYTFPLIQSVNPYVKIIIILRNPIYRAYSSWKLAAKHFNETKSFEDAINDEIENKLNENKTFYTAVTHYLQRGLYYEQLRELFKWFPRHNILILISEYVKLNMESEYDKVYEFLNLNKFKTTYNLEFESDDKSQIDSNLYNKLIKFYKDDVTKLEKLLNIQTKWFN
jgi:hypothetical protein